MAILTLASIAFLALFGYLAGGIIYAKVRLDDADSAYSTAADDQNGLTQLIDTLSGSSAPASAATVSPAELKHDRDVFALWVSASEIAQTQVATDDQSLADVTAALARDRWLTPIGAASLDRASRRIAAERLVLKDAKSIITDYVQIGSFYQSFADIGLDYYAIATSAQARDLGAITSGLAKVRADTAIATSFDKAPGLPPDVGQLMGLIQVINGDFSNLLNAAISRNASALTAALKAGRAHVAKLQAFDNTKLVTMIEAFYTPMIDAYHRDVAKARAA